MATKKKAAKKKAEVLETPVANEDTTALQAEVDRLRKQVKELRQPEREDLHRTLYTFEHFHRAPKLSGDTKDRWLHMLDNIFGEEKARELVEHCEENGMFEKIKNRLKARSARGLEARKIQAAQRVAAQQAEAERLERLG